MQVLLFNVILCLPPLHTCWEISGAGSASDKKKTDWLLNGISGFAFYISICSFHYLPMKPCFFFNVSYFAVFPFSLFVICSLMLELSTMSS